jgi:hypothetical protein
MIKQKNDIDVIIVGKNMVLNTGYLLLRDMPGVQGSEMVRARECHSHRNNRTKRNLIMLIIVVGMIQVQAF